MRHNKHSISHTKNSAHSAFRGLLLGVNTICKMNVDAELLMANTFIAFPDEKGHYHTLMFLLENTKDSIEVA